MDSSIDPSWWEAVKVNGKIYGVINQQISARAPAFAVPTNNVDLMKLNLEEMKNYKLADYGKYLKQIKEMTGIYCLIGSIWSQGGYQLYGFDEVLGNSLLGAIRYAEDKPKIINQYESAEFQEYMKLRREWVTEGLSYPEIGGPERKSFSTYANEGKITPWLLMINTYTPGYETGHEAVYGIPHTTVTRSETLLTSYGILATLTGINSETRYPEKTMKFLEYINTDKEVYNLLCYGIEGTNYEKTEQGRVKPMVASPYTASSWSIGNTYNSYLLENQPVNIYEEIDKINKEAKKSPLLGFAPDTEEFKVEMANCKSIIGEYLEVLDQGLVDIDEIYPQFISKLKSAGVDTVVQKMQTQLDK